MYGAFENIRIIIFLLENTNEDSRRKKGCGKYETQLLAAKSIDPIFTFENEVQVL